VGIGVDDVLAAWYAVDADVEEAADGDGEEETILNLIATSSINIPNLYLY